jgi:zinc transporter
MSTDDQQLQAEDGLVYAFELDKKGGGRQIGWPDIDADPAAPHRWIHLDFTQARAQRWLGEKSGIDSVIVNALLDEDSRPRALVHDDGMLVTLRGVNSNPDSDAEDMVSIRMWLEKDRIITTRRRRLMSVKSLRESITGGNGPTDSASFLTALVNRMNERIGPVIDRLDDTVEQSEDQFAGNSAEPYAGQFSALRREAARIRRYLGPQREALERIARDSNGLLSTDQSLLVREEADELTRYMEDLDLIRERSMVAQEELLGQLANEQNRRMYVLSLVAAIFLPLSFLTGLLGMNVAGLPGTEDPAAFFMLCGLMGVVAVGIVVLFKWQKWL